MSMCDLVPSLSFCLFLHQEKGQNNVLTISTLGHGFESR